MTAEKAIFELIKSALSEVGDRVYAQVAPQNAETPYVIFQRTDSERLGRHMQGPSGLAQATIQIDIYSASYNEAKDLANKLEDEIDGFRGDVAYGSDSPQDTIKIGGISLQYDVDIFDDTAEPFLRRSSNSYLVTYHREVTP